MKHSKSKFKVHPLINLSVLLVLSVIIVVTSIKHETKPAEYVESEQDVSTSLVGDDGEGMEFATPVPEDLVDPAEPVEPTSAPEATPPPVKDVEGIATNNLSALFLIDDTAYEYYSFSLKCADKYIDALNKAAELLPADVGLYDMLVPTSASVMLDQETLDKIGSDDQEEAMNYIYGSLDDRVSCVDIFGTLCQHRDEYIFFRSDHHWTNLGGYYAYKQVMEDKGLKPLELSDYTLMESDGYLGSFYDQSGKAAAIANNPDTLQAFVPPDAVTMDVTQKDGTVLADWPMIYDPEDYGTSLKYICFIGGDNPYTEIKNENAESDKSCVLIKESFGNAFAPYLTSYYKTVYVIDYRYYNGTIPNLVSEKGISDVYVMNNMSATRNEYLVDNLTTVLGG